MLVARSSVQTLPPRLEENDELFERRQKASNQIRPSIATLFLLFGSVMTIDPNELHASEEFSGGEFLVVIGFMGFAVYAIWWFIDLFTIPNQVDKYNEGIEIETIKSFKQE